VTRSTLATEGVSASGGCRFCPGVPGEPGPDRSGGFEAKSLILQG
jgi:hypothetical protein